MSHTVTAKSTLSDKECLTVAVQALGGRVLGEGNHELFENSAEGFGFHLKNWSYPCVLKADNSLAYDDYGGRWGKVSDFDRLNQEYSVAVLSRTAQQQGYTVLGRTTISTQAGPVIQLEVSR